MLRYKNGSYKRFAKAGSRRCRYPGKFSKIADSLCANGNEDLYGFASASLEQARTLIESALTSTFIAHESSYRGGTYYRIGVESEEHFILQNYFDPSEREWMETGFSEHQVLLYVAGTERADEIEKLLTGQISTATLLRRARL